MHSWYSRATKRNAANGSSIDHEPAIFHSVLRAFLLAAALFVSACQPGATPISTTPPTSETTARPLESATTSTTTTPTAKPVVNTPMTRTTATTATTTSAAPQPRTGPVTDGNDAIERAIPAANAALDQAYAKAAEPREPHNGSWVWANRAQVEGNTARGFVVRWWSNPPAGFAIEVIVQVNAQGETRVTRATASFSPD